MPRHLRRTAAVAAACALIAAGAGCGPHTVAVSAPVRRCPPPSTGRIVDQNGKPVTITGKAAAELAPPDPDGGLVCGYGTPFPGSAKPHLETWAALTARSARQLAAQLDGLPRGRPCCPPGATCAGVGGAYQGDTLVLTYPNGPAAYASVRISGGPGPCNGVTNGVVTRSSTPALFDTLAALTGDGGAWAPGFQFNRDSAAGEAIVER